MSDQVRLILLKRVFPVAASFQSLGVWKLQLSLIIYHCKQSMYNVDSRALKAEKCIAQN